MSLRIGTNVPSLAAQRNLSRSDRDVAHALEELASGSRLTHAGDDAAGFAIAEILRGQAASLKQAKQNADGAIGLLQVAEGSLAEQNNILVRLRELSIQAASDTVADTEREFLDSEYQQLAQEFDRIAVTTRYGSKPLLTGTNESFEFHLGTGNGEQDIVKYKLASDTRASAVGINGLSVSTKSDANDSIVNIDEALEKVASARAGFGAIQSRLEYASSHLEIQREGVVSAHSRIADADVAESVSKLTAGRIRQQFGTSVLAQANSTADLALRLLT